MDEDAVYYEPPIHSVIFIAGKLRHECTIEYTENLPEEGEFIILNEFGNEPWKVEMVIKKYEKRMRSLSEKRRYCTRLIYLEKISPNDT